MVRLELGKKDFIWIGLIVVLLGVGFAYGFGGNNPAVMGHSVDEIEGAASVKYVDTQIASLQKQINGLTSSHSGCPTKKIFLAEYCFADVLSKAHGTSVDVTCDNEHNHNSCWGIANCNNGVWAVSGVKCKSPSYGGNR